MKIIYEDIDENNLTKQHEILTVFGYVALICLIIENLI